MRTDGSIFLYTLFLSALLYSAPVPAHDGHGTQSDVAHPVSQPIWTVKRTVACFQTDDSQRSKQLEEEATHRLPRRAKFWLNEDVVYIISPEERCAYLHLATDQARDEFEEQFWLRRNPNPESMSNSFEEEHYRRIVFANEKYGGRSPGWSTDRGRVYITFGPPDSIELEQTKEGSPESPDERPRTYRYPTEIWHYNFVEGLGKNVHFEFVDPNGSGNFRLVAAPKMEDESSLALFSKPRASNRRGIPSKSKIQVYVGPTPSPRVQFKDLEAMVVSRIVREQVHFSYRTEFQKATHATTLAEISIDVPKSQQNLASTNGTSPIDLAIFGRVSKSSGWVVDTFERKVSLAQGQNNSGQIQPDSQFDLAIVPGTYRLAIVVKDLANEETETLYTFLRVPPYEEIRQRCELQ
jgi:GWxTD domain-containing protein